MENCKLNKKMCMQRMYNNEYEKAKCHQPNNWQSEKEPTTKYERNQRK